MSETRNASSSRGGELLDKGLAAAFGGDGRTTQPSVLKRLEERTQSKLGVQLESQGPEAAPVRVTEEVKALRDPTGRYQLLGEIGRGGMGVVYKGRDQDLGRDVAMKVLKDEYAARADVLARFVEEAQIGGQLQHPGIVPVYELGLQAGERPYFAMKLVKGETLAAQLAKHSDATQERRRLLGIFEQVCQTVAYAHARHVVHRDLKPANVMIGAFGEVQVVDWGLAKVLQKGVDEHGGVKIDAQRSVIETVRSHDASGSKSVVGSMLGTPAYMPPEQALGDIARVDERSDVFALGAILCKILTGDAPYREEDGDLIRQAAQAQLDGAYERLGKCGADEAVVLLCRECLAPSQRARPANAGEVAQSIGAYLTSVEERARQAEVRAAEARLKHRVTLMAAGAGVLVLALATGGWLWLDAQTRTRRTEAAQRVATAMSAASGARGRAQSAGTNMSLWSTALSATEQVVLLAKSDDVDAKARADAEALLKSVQEESDAAQAESARLERDKIMLATLETARIPLDEDVRVSGLEQLRHFDQAYARAFSDYLGGGSLFDQPSETVLVSLRRGDIEPELAGSLDHWGLVRDALSQAPQAPDPASTARLRAVATQLEAGDPWRTELRALLPSAAQQRARLRELAERADFATLTAVGCRVLSQALWSAGEKESSVKVLSEGLEHHPQDFDLCFQLALRLELLDRPRAQEALAAYRIAHAIRPEQIEVLHREMLALGDLSQHVDEERIARMALAREPLDPHWHHHVATALAEQGRSQEASEEYRRALELDPKREVTRAAFGIALAHAGHPEEGIAELRIAIEQGPNDVGHRIDLGNALSDLGRRAEAEESYRTAVDLDPKHAEAHSRLGVLLLQEDRSDEAIDEFRAAIELDPNDVQSRSNLGFLLLQQNELDEALSVLQAATELGPQHGSVYYNLGDVLSRQGKLQEALPNYRKAVELAPTLVDYHMRLGVALVEAGKPEEAIAVFRHILEIDPNSASAMVDLAATLVSQGNLDEALELYRDAADLFSEDPSPFGRQWLEESRARIASLEQQIASHADLEAVLAGRAPVSSEEWNAAIQFAYAQHRYREAVELTERTSRDATEQIEDGFGLYDTACCAALLAASADASVDAEDRMHARALAREWLSRSAGRWKARDAFQHALVDADLAGVRGAAIDGLPEAERAAWRALWQQIEAGAAK